MHKLNIEVGQKFGRLTVVQELPNRLIGITERRKIRCFLCQCDCGKTHEINISGLANKGTKSCGCLLGLAHTHGESRAGKKEYKTWHYINERCHNTKHKSYKNYGGRGITVCDRWRHSYETFLSDMGRAPSSKHTMDRIDSNKSYEPSNCRWATMKEQQNNRRNNLNIGHNGEVLTMAQWAERLNENYQTLRGWLNYKKGRTIADFISRRRYKRHIDGYTI